MDSWLARVVREAKKVGDAGGRDGQKERGTKGRRVNLSLILLCLKDCINDGSQVNHVIIFVVVYFILSRLLYLQWLPKELERMAQFQYFFLCLPLPHTMLIYLEIWVKSLGTGVPNRPTRGTGVPNRLLSSKSNIVPGGGGYRFHLWGDLLRRPLKG